jgi:hypothetical protein
LPSRQAAGGELHGLDKAYASQTAHSSVYGLCFALGLVRANNAKGSVKMHCKSARWSPEFLLQRLQLN